MLNQDFRDYHIRSYVKRGRITAAQKQVLAKHQNNLATPDTLVAKIDAMHKQHHFTSTILEIGFGNGESLALMAKHNPQQLFIGIEVHVPGIARLLSEQVKENLPNLLIVVGDAYLILRDHMEKQSVDRMQIFFPDPWPKQAHHKRRLINSVFVDIALQVLKPKSRLHIATDWQPYAEAILQMLSADQRLVNSCEGFAERPDYRPVTKFEQAGFAKKHQSFDIIFHIV